MRQESAQLQKISLLLNAIEAWREADADFALNGEYGAVAEVWDAAKARMAALADEIRAAMSDLPAPTDGLRTKAVVTVKEPGVSLGTNGLAQTSKRVREFPRFDEACKWVRRDIAKMKTKYRARRPRAADDAVYSGDGKTLASYEVHVAFA